MNGQKCHDTCGVPPCIKFAAQCLVLLFVLDELEFRLDRIDMMWRYMSMSMSGRADWKRVVRQWSDVILRYPRDRMILMFFLVCNRYWRTG
jgi:hypothetical protein